MKHIVLEKSKRGQNELIGFVMVVLLISVGMLFVVAFSLSSSKADIKKIYSDKQMASRFNSAILSANSECKTLSYERLIVDCAEGAQIVCSSSPIVYSCDYVQESVNGLLGHTLEDWGYDYFYRVWTPSQDLINVQQGACKRDIEVHTLYLQSRNGLVTIQMGICE